MRTYNQLIELFGNIADAHHQIHSFGAGEVWQIDAAHEPSLMPKLWVVPGEVTVADNVMTYALTVLCFDLVRKDESNLQEVLSDTQLILLDVVKVLRGYQNEWFLLEGDPRLNPFTERFGEDVSGWRMDIQVNIDFANNECDMPMSEFVIPGSETPGGGGMPTGCCEGDPNQVLYYGADGLVTSDQYFSRTGQDNFSLGAKDGADPELRFDSDGQRIGWSVEGGPEFSLPKVNGAPGQVLTEDGVGDLYWSTVATGGGTWGSITGTLSDQTDLQNALDAKENLSNKSTNVLLDKNSNTKYPTVKSVYDWVTINFPTASDVASQIAAALVGYATEAWVASQGYITNVITALGYTPEDAANKTDAMAGNTASSTKYLSAKGVYDWVVGLGYSALSKATSADINTGSDDAKYVTALGLNDSKFLTQAGDKLSATASGTDTYTATLSPAITSYSSTLRVWVKFTNANTGAATLNLNGLGAKSIKKSVTTDLSAGDISAGQVLNLAYDGTNFQVVGGSGGGTWGSIAGTLSNQTDLQNALNAKENVSNKSTTTTLGTSDTLYPTQNAVKTYVDNAVGVQSINAQTGTTYTFVLTDTGKLVTGSNSSSITFTVPPNSSVAFAVGTHIDITQTGVGVLSIAAGVGVTINSQDNNKKIFAQYVSATLIKTATDDWLLVGNLRA